MASVADTIKAELKALSSPAKAKASAWFFKTGEGEYGEGDRFIGVTVPEQRKVAKRHAGAGYGDLGELLESPVHEHRLTALFVLVSKYKAADTAGKREAATFYLARLDRVNNWDLVDSSAPYILGDWLFDKDRSPLHTLSRSRDLWKRRVAIISTLGFIARGDSSETYAIARTLMRDPEDLIHKAVGWMLREAGKRDSEDELVAFLEECAPHMPRTMLRYSIERLRPSERKRFLSMKRGV